MIENIEQLKDRIRSLGLTIGGEYAASFGIEFPKLNLLASVSYGSGNYCSNRHRIFTDYTNIDEETLNAEIAIFPFTGNFTVEFGPGYMSYVEASDIFYLLVGLKTAEDNAHGARR